jgi:uncharacterized protein (DUF2336 family)
MAVEWGMASQRSLLFDLQALASQEAPGRNADKLHSVVDLFLNGSVHFSEEQVAVFDDVIGHLVDRIEVEARIRLAQRLAPISNAPPLTIRRLAFDDEIDVAAPVLTNSKRLTDDLLVENSQTKGQGHLMAISRRQPLAATVTDVIVERGNREVVCCVAANPTAQFSSRGYVELTRRAGRDDELLTSVGLRPDLPRSLLLQLLAKASDLARAKLLTAHPGAAREIKEVVRRTAEDIAADAAPRSYAAAQVKIAALHAAGKLGESELKGFALAGNFEETAVALARLGGMSIEFVERALLQKRPETMLVLTKAAGHTWPTAEAILEMRARLGVPYDLDECLAGFDHLQRSIAEKVLHLLRRGGRS